jgi:AcrR family transcriptional regulator
MKTKEKIFEVSIDLFSEYGYDGVSIRQIAKEVGIKESSIYNHYKSKKSILKSILDYYLYEMTKEEIPLVQASQNLDINLDYFYNQGLELYISKLKNDKMMKITRIFIIESYHNEEIKNFVKKAVINGPVQGWIELFNLIKEKGLINESCDTKQLAESFYYYSLFLLIQHFIFDYPQDNDEFLKKLSENSKKHFKIIIESVKER